jgi:photosystem II stability/assembly factor-like uncharacterized protein
MNRPIWQQSTLNGGGFIAGLLQDPHQPEILYARSDVAGVFRSTDGGRSWESRNNGMAGYHQHDVRSFAISRHDPQVLFRGSGSNRGGVFFGAIHKTVNGGDSWFPVCTQVDFYGNGESRQYGEVIQVDPHDPDCVVAGGYSGGLWISTDGGETWRYAGLRDERIVCVCFHPARPNVLFVSTIHGYDRDPPFVAQQFDYVRPNPPRLYVSAGRGAAWDVLHEGLDFGELAFDPNNPDLIHGACLKDGVFRSTDGGRTWVNPAPGLSKYPIGTITVDPNQPSRVFAAAETFPNNDPEVPPIGVYESRDAGHTWSLVRWHTDSDIRNYPSYMSLPYAGWAIAKIRVHPQASQTLYLSNWYGVAISTDGGQTWDANHFRGMENICIENMVSHPGRAHTVFMVSADHAPKYSTDGGKTFAGMPQPRVESTQPDSTAIVASRFRPDTVLYAVKGPQGCSIIRCGIDGQNAQVVFHRPGVPDTDPSRLMFQSRAAGISVQALAEDPFTAGTFYAYLDGILAQGAGLWRSTDWGDHWAQPGNPFPAHISRVPHQRFWIENELLSVVISQTKNVCGTNQMLCVDPHRQGTIYIGEWTEGLFRTADGGRSWERIGTDLPFGRDRASVLNVIRADDGRPGVLYAGFIREGLWQSTDFGDTWRRIYPLDERIFNATSVAVGGADGRTLVVACEPLYWADAPSAVVVTRDAGQTWQDIYDPKLGAVRWKTVTMEPGENRFYAGSCGNSAFVVELDAADA